MHNTCLLSTLIFSFSTGVLRRVRIAFTLGIDATKLVKCWQVSKAHGVLVGGAYPNHYISLEGLEKEAIAARGISCWETCSIS